MGNRTNLTLANAINALEYAIDGARAVLEAEGFGSDSPGRFGGRDRERIALFLVRGYRAAHSLKLLLEAGHGADARAIGRLIPETLIELSFIVCGTDAETDERLALFYDHAVYERLATMRAIDRLYGGAPSAETQRLETEWQPLASRFDPKSPWKWQGRPYENLGKRAEAVDTALPQDEVEVFRTHVKDLSFALGCTFAHPSGASFESRVLTVDPEPPNDDDAQFVISMGLNLMMLAEEVAGQLGRGPAAPEMEEFKRRSGLGGQA
jgi:hypothetical protein